MWHQGLNALKLSLGQVRTHKGKQLSQSQLIGDVWGKCVSFQVATEENRCCVNVSFFQQISGVSPAKSTDWFLLCSEWCFIQYDRRNDYCFLSFLCCSCVFIHDDISVRKGLFCLRNTFILILNVNVADVNVADDSSVTVHCSILNH